MMIDAQRKWPFGLDAAGEPLFFRLVFLIFVAALLADAPVTRAVAALPDTVRAPFYHITRLGNSDWILIPTLIAAILGFSAGRLLFRGVLKARVLTVASVAAFTFAAVAVPGIAVNLVKRLVGRSRPVNFGDDGIFSFSPVLNGWDHQSFPSGDTTTIFALAAVLAFFLPRLVWFWVAVAALVGLSRIMVGVHFPTDVFGGMLAGTFGAFAMRNFCAGKGWIFAEPRPGRYVPRFNWPSDTAPARPSDRP